MWQGKICMNNFQISFMEADSSGLAAGGDTHGINYLDKRDERHSDNEWVILSQKKKGTREYQLWGLKLELLIPGPCWFGTNCGDNVYVNESNDRLLSREACFNV